MSSRQAYFVGDKLECVDGSIVTVVEVNRKPYYESFMCDDNIWRYDRKSKFGNGRTTGRPTYPPYPKSIAAGHPLNNPNKVRLAMESFPKFPNRIIMSNGEIKLNVEKSLEKIARELDHLFDMIPDYELE